MSLLKSICISFVVLFAGSHSVSAQISPYAPELIPEQNWLSLEQMLRVAGYPTGIVDGQMDNQTQRAYRQFMVENDLGKFGDPFTPDHYRVLFDMATAIQNGQRSADRPNWKLTYSEVWTALRIMGCYGDLDRNRLRDDAKSQADATAALCYKMSRQISPLVETLDGVDFKAMVLDVSDGLRVSSDIYAAALRDQSPQVASNGPPAGYTLAKKAQFGSGMKADLFVNFASSSAACRTPKAMIIINNLTSGPNRAALEGAAKSVEFAIKRIAKETCSGRLPNPEISLQAGGTIWMTHDYSLNKPAGYRGDGATLARTRRGELAAEITAAWSRARTGQAPAPLGGSLTDAEFFASLRKPGIATAILQGDLESTAIGTDVRPGLLYVWKTYVEYYEAACFDGALSSLTEAEKLDLAFIKSVKTGEVIRTRTDTATDAEWVEWRVRMKAKFGETYLRLIQGNLRRGRSVFLSPNIEPFVQDVRAIVGHYRCLGPNLEMFEDNLLKAALEWGS